MATQVQQRRGTTAQHNVFTGANGELTVDTSKDTLVIHDGTTQGGFPLARESALTPLATASDVPHIFNTTSTPSGAKIGDLWWDSGSEVLSIAKEVSSTLQWFEV
jgi:hypothetical protein